MEKVAIKAYTINLKKGKEIIMHYIKELIAEGKTYFPPFEGSKGRPRSKTYPDSLEIKDASSAVEEEEAVVVSVIHRLLKPLWSPCHIEISRVVRLSAYYQCVVLCHPLAHSIHIS